MIYLHTYIHISHYFIIFLLNYKILYGLRDIFAFVFCYQSFVYCSLQMFFEWHLLQPNKSRSKNIGIMDWIDISQMLLICVSILAELSYWKFYIYHFGESNVVINCETIFQINVQPSSWQNEWLHSSDI